jgi:hypothetical protein
MVRLMRIYGGIATKLNSPQSLFLWVIKLMLVAYWTADHDALISVFSDPGKLYMADPIYLPVRVADGANLWSWIPFGRYVCLKNR